MDLHETRTLIRFNTFMHARTHARMKFETANDFTWEMNGAMETRGKSSEFLHCKRALDSFLGTEIGIGDWTGNILGLAWE